jgi:hypothetical protein
MKTETRQFTVYDWEALPDEGKAKALENYRDINTEHFAPEEWVDSETLYNLGLPTCFTLGEIGYSVGGGQGDGASVSLEVPCVKALVAHYTTEIPRLKKLLPLALEYLLVEGGGTLSGYRYYTAYYPPEITLDGYNYKTYPRIEALVSDLNKAIHEDHNNISRALYRYIDKTYYNDMSDEMVIDTLKNNEYMFTIDGRIA